jgi:hypothetical protein
MKFQKIGLDELLGELGELPAEWMDPQAREVVAEIRSATQSLRELERPISTAPGRPRTCSSNATG